MLGERLTAADGDAFGGSAVNAQAPTGSATAHLGLQSQPVALPGVGQVILVFLFVAALAVALAALIRRVSPRLLNRLQPMNGPMVSVLARQSLEPGVSLHIVSVAGERVAVVTSRAGVAIHGFARASDPVQPTTGVRS